MGKCGGWDPKTEREWAGDWGIVGKRVARVKRGEWDSKTPLGSGWKWRERGCEIGRRVEKRKGEHGQEGPVAAVGHRGCGAGIRGGSRSSGRAGGCRGAPPELCPAPTGVCRGMMKSECHFIKGTERVRLVQRSI